MVGVLILAMNCGIRQTRWKINQKALLNENVLVAMSWLFTISLIDSRPTGEEKSYESNNLAGINKQLNMIILLLVRNAEP